MRNVWYFYPPSNDLNEILRQISHLYSHLTISSNLLTILSPFLSQAENKEESPGACLKRSESSKPSLWKDNSLFTKPENGKKTEIANEKTLRVSNNTITTKPALAKNTTDIISDQTSIKESAQIPSTKKPKPVGMVTPSVKMVPERTEVQQPDSTQVNHVNREVEHDHAPSENIENRSTSREHNRVS